MKRKKIIFVCTGNTCRSPMAEALLRHKIKRDKIKWWDAASCGIHAEVGGSISRHAVEALAEVGASCDKFKPRQLTQKILDGSVLVVTMTSAQKQVLEGCAHVLSVKDICGYEVPDPYGGTIEDYRAARDAINRACEVIVKNFIPNYKENV